MWKEGRTKRKSKEGRRGGWGEVRDMGREGGNVGTYLICEGSVKYKHLTPWHMVVSINTGPHFKEPAPSENIKTAQVIFMVNTY